MPAYKATSPGYKLANHPCDGELITPLPHKMVNSDGRAWIVRMVEGPPRVRHHVLEKRLGAVDTGCWVNASGAAALRRTTDAISRA